MEVTGYRLGSCIHEGSQTRIFRGERCSDGAKVIIKVHRSELPRPGDVARFRNHFNVTTNLSSTRIDRPIALEQHGNVLALISEDRGEISLREEMRKSPPSPARVLTIGIALARTLEDLHIASVIHKDIKPDNILVNPDTGTLRLGDFSIATLLPREAREAQRDTALSGTLAYVSPEQTGRLHRWIDHRADLYSLGATLYELATGTVPFPSTDPMELIHAHLTRRPPRPSTLNPALSASLCDIIMKLLAKSPAERYQSPTGLRIDLEECFRQERDQGFVTPFPLAQYDALERFVVSDELYGRASEIERLLSTFDRVARGASALFFLAGSSGIGKSALVRAVQEPILERRGYFAAGKFDQYNRDVPFSSLVQAFRDLLRQILAEHRDRVAACRSLLLAALGSEGRVVTDVIPEVELLIGTQPSIPELPPVDNRERFLRIFTRFIRVFASTEHPLVLFLDDLQWADAATLELLVALFGNDRPKAFMFLGAYRDNEVDSAHPLLRAISQLQGQGVIVDQMTLAPLELPDVTSLVAGTLHCSPADAQEIARVIDMRTAGNPFYCNRYLQSLYDDGLVRFNRTTGRFECDIESLREPSSGADVVGFMVGRVERFTAETRDALKFAAAIGSRFSLDTLAAVRGLSRAQVAEGLWPALVEGLILPLDETYRVFQGAANIESIADLQSVAASYRFLHDRVQQAAYLLIAADERAATHLHIGRLLLSSTPEEQRDDVLFDVIGHIEGGRALVIDPDERIAFARLYLRAGEKARSSTAYSAATRYFTSGLQLLDTVGFSEQYELAMALCKKCAEATYLEGYFERSEVLIRRAIAEARSSLDKADAYMTLIVQYTLRALYPQAIEAGREALALLGIELPREDLLAARDREMAEIEKRIDGRSIESLFDLPTMTAPDKLVAMRLLTTMGPPTYRSHQSLWSVICSMAVNLTLQYGNTPQVAYSHTSYGGLLGWAKNDYARGEQFGALAARLADSFGSSPDRTVAALMVGSSLRHWSAPLSRSSRDYNEAYTIGLDSGNLQYAAYAFGHNMYCRFWQGVPLDQLLSEIAGYLAFSESRKNRWAIDLLDGGRLIASTLAARTQDGDRFRLSTLDEATYIRRCHENANTQVLCIYAILKSEALYLLDDLEGARNASQQAQAHIAEVGTQGLLPWARHVFISALIAARLAQRSKDEMVRRDLRAEVERGMQQSRVWAERNPTVFRHVHCLLSAELAFLDEKFVEAIDLGDAALDAARQAMYPQDTGIAAECVASYWQARGRTSIMRHYIIESCHAFRRWGAIAKETQQRLAHPSIFDSMSNERFAPVRVDQTIGADFAAEEILDLGTVLVATQSIFGEIVLDRLLETFLRIAMENAGASRGFLILPKGEELPIAQCSIADSVGGCTNVSAAGGRFLSEGVVRQVIRTGLPVVLEDGELGALATDPYLAQKHPPSLACLPMSNRGRLVAIVYLENDLVPACFTPNRLALLRVLGTQAAIAIDNATLYADVQRAETEARRAREHLADQVDARTRDLHEANIELTRRADELSLVGERLAMELSQREVAERERATLQEAVIEAQRARLLEMSTPIIPISDEIVVMPLIGVMDDIRAGQVMETALEGVSARGARTMILDLTGMRHVDSSVARTLVDAANALRLLGCATILTGVRAEMARSITEVGLDLGQIITCATLQSGINRALGRSGREQPGKR